MNRSSLATWFLLFCYALLVSTLFIALLVVAFLSYGTIAAVVAMLGFLALVATALNRFFASDREAVESELAGAPEGAARHG